MLSVNKLKSTDYLTLRFKTVPFKQTDRQTQGQTDTRTDRHKNRQTQEQTDTRTDRHKNR